MNRVLCQIGPPVEVDVVRESVLAVEAIGNEFDREPVFFCYLDNPFEHRMCPAFNPEVRSEIGGCPMRQHIARRTQRPEARGDFIAVFFTLSCRRRRIPAAADDHERSRKRGTHKKSLYRGH